MQIKEKIVIDMINTEDQINSTTVLQLKNIFAEKLSKTGSKDPRPPHRQLKCICLLVRLGSLQHSNTKTGRRTKDNTQSEARRLMPALL